MRGRGRPRDITRARVSANTHNLPADAGATGKHEHSRKGTRRVAPDRRSVFGGSHGGGGVIAVGDGAGGGRGVIEFSGEAEDSGPAVDPAGIRVWARRGGVGAGDAEADASELAAVCGDSGGAEGDQHDQGPDRGEEGGGAGEGGGGAGAGAGGGGAGAGADRQLRAAEPGRFVPVAGGAGAGGRDCGRVRSD